MEIESIGSLEELTRRAEAGTLIGLFDISNEHYHAGPGASSSGLKEILRSPAHYEERRANPSTSAIASAELARRKAKRAAKVSA